MGERGKSLTSLTSLTNGKPLDERTRLRLQPKPAGPVQRSQGGNAMFASVRPGPAATVTPFTFLRRSQNNCETCHD